MAVLPTPGGSTGTWGTELNDWLLEDHNADGTHNYPGGGGVEVDKNDSDVTAAARSRLNFVEGTGVTLTVTDDAPNDEVDITVATTAYVPGGTDVALADGGTGASLTDPNADRIFFWDDSAGSTAFLTPGTNLSISGTTLNASGGGSGVEVDKNDSDVTAAARGRLNFIEGSNITLTITDDSGNDEVDITIAATGGGGGGSGMFDAYVYLREQQAANTNGGSSAGDGSYHTRVLNTEVSDDEGICTLSSNQFTLAAGTYLIRARHPIHASDWFKTRLRNVTDSTTVLVGSSSYAASSDAGHADGTVVGIFTIAASKALEIQYRCLTTKSTNGLGVLTNFGEVEVFTEVELWRLGTGGGGGGGGYYDAVAILRDEKTANTDGGASSTGSWIRRVLNVESDPEGIVTLDTVTNVGRITLPAGTYEVEGESTFFKTGRTKLRLWDITNTALLVPGLNVYLGSGSNDGGVANLRGRFTLAGTTDVELQYRVESSDGLGLGAATNWSVAEVYSELKIARISSGSSGGGLFDAYAMLRHQETAGTGGGTSSTGSFIRRKLNVESFDDDGIVSLDTVTNIGRFTLQAGDYFIRARAPFYTTGRSLLKIRNITDSSDAVLGGCIFATDGGNDSTFAHLAGRVSIASAKDFELQYRVANSSGASIDLGVDANFGVTEVYAEVEIWREA